MSLIPNTGRKLRLPALHLVVRLKPCDPGPEEILRAGWKDERIMEMDLWLIE
jgi:hypothetical protein